MAKTYLQLVNLVLQNLREDAVTSVSFSTYSTLVGSWVNEAKTMVENSTRWQRLRRGVTFNLAAGVQSYDLSSTTLVGAGNTVNDRATLIRSTVNRYMPLAFDVTTSDPFQLIDVGYEYAIEQRELLAAQPNNQPKPINFALSRNSGGMAVELWEVPTGVRSWKIYFCAPQDDLSADADSMIVPHKPVVDIATSIALDERGEEIGEPGTTVDQRIHTILADAVALDHDGAPLFFEAS